MNIVLIGYRGSGKTTVAGALAERLGWRAVDADHELEIRAGRSIAEIFAADGEAAFRDLETKVLAELIDEPQIVLASGGGVVLREENRRLLQRAGVVVWLEADAETVAQRLAADRTTAARRPNLTAHGGRPEIERLLAQREPLYRRCSAFSVQTPGRSVEHIISSILEQLAALGWSIP